MWLRYRHASLSIFPSPNWMRYSFFIEDVKATIRLLLGILILISLYHKTPEVGEFMFLDPGKVHRLLLGLALV